MRKLSILFVFAIIHSTLIAQPGRDGDMRVDIRHLDAWNEDRNSNSGIDAVEVPAYELNLEYGTRDFPDLDGANYTSSGIVSYSNGSVLGGPYISNIPDRTETYTYGAFNTLGPNPAPEGIQMTYEGWEKDCFDCFRCTGTFLGICVSFQCDQCSRSVNYSGGCPCSGNILCSFGCSDDDFLTSGSHTGTNFYDFRAFVPQAFSPTQTVRTNAGGISSADGRYDLGTRLQSRWTSPCVDTLWANRTVLCEPDFVTLFTGGAVFGGDYVWYYSTDGFITQDSIVTSNVDSTLTIFLARSTTFRVHTRNGPNRSFNSWSYREIDIVIDKPEIADINVSNPNCFGANDGQIEIIARPGAGTPPLEYTIDNFTTVQASNTFNVGGGFYIANIRDANGCKAAPLGATITIVEPNDLVASVVSVTDVDCNGASTGEANISVTGGTTPYSFNWTDVGGATVSTSEDLAGVAAGTYDLTVTDGNNCTETLSVTINEPPVLTSSIMGDSVSCFGASDGSVDFTLSGGTPPYSFTWNNGFTTEDLINVGGGTYTVQGRDANGCSVTETFAVFEPAELELTFTVTDVLCNGGADGAIDITVLGGNGGNMFDWSDGTTTFATTEDVSGLSGGTYFITVTDRKGCTVTESITVNEPAQNMSISTSFEDVTCFGASDGSIDVSVLGGTPPYTFAWDTGTAVFATTEDLIDIPGGTYNVLITDDNGCTETTSVTITEPAAPLSVMGGAMAITSINCFGASSGSASVNVMGGTAPYSYLWSNFDTASTVSGLTAGPISVIISDVNGCELYLRDTVDGPTEGITITLDSLFNIACAGGDEGAIFTTVTGGTTPYTIQWLPTGVVSSTTEDAENLEAGTYTLDILDANGCKAAETFTISEPDSLESSIALTQPDCPDEETGQALVGVNGGVAPYSFEWNTMPPQLGVLATGLAGDSTTYTVTITDANDCVLVDSALVIDPEPLSVTTIPSEVSCFSGSDGEVAVQVTGGTAPYRYELNGLLQTDSVFTNLSAGNYQVVVEDNKGCQALVGFAINPISELMVELSANPDGLVVRAQDVELVSNLLNTTATTNVVDYQWLDGDGITITACDGSPTCTVNPEEETTYTLQVFEEVAGDTCVIITTLTVPVTLETIPFIPSAFSPNGDGVNDCFAMNVLGASNLAVTVYNRWGEDIYSNPSQSNGPAGPDQASTVAALDDYCQTQGDAWDGTYKGELVPAGAYVYQVVVTYFDGTTEVLNGTVSVIY